MTGPEPTKWYIYLIWIFVLIILLTFSAIFSSAETAYTSVGVAKIETMVENKARGAKLIKKQHQFFNRTLGTILIANNLVNILASVLFSYILSLALIPGKYQVLISTVVMTPIIVLFSEIIPKVVAKMHPIGVIKSFYWFIELLYWLFIPLTFPISKIGKKIYITNTEEDVKNLIDIANEEGVLEMGESSMAQNALDLDSTKVIQHYIKLKNVDYVNWKCSISEVLNKFKETNYSRLPVERDDNFIGIIHLKDIFYLQKGNIMNYIKTVPIVSANSILSIALEKIRQARAQMAFVVNNNNSDKIIGIITIEDIIEEVVGEIYDEYDNDELIYEVSLEKCLAKGVVKMKDLWKQLEFKDLFEFELSEEEEELNLSSWLNLKLNHKLRLNSKYEYKEKIEFKLVEKQSQRKNCDVFEIDWGN